MNRYHYLNANGKVVRRYGNTWKIISQQLGGVILAQAEAVCGPAKGQLIDLKFSRSPLAKEIKNAVELGLVS